MADHLKKLEEDLKALPTNIPDDDAQKVQVSLRTTLTKAIEAARAKVAPLATALKKAEDGVKATETTLKEAETKLATATRVATDPVTAQITALAIQVATANAERDQAKAEAKSAAALQAEVAGFCDRNPSNQTLCVSDIAKAAIVAVVKK